MENTAAKTGSWGTGMTPITRGPVAPRKWPSPPKVAPSLVLGNILIAADYAAGTIAPLGLLPDPWYYQPIANVPNVIALAGDGVSTIWMLRQILSPPLLYSVAYPSAPNGPASNYMVPLACRNGMVCYQDALYFLLPDGSIPLLGSGQDVPPLPVAPDQSQGLALDPQTGFLFAASQQLIYVCNLSRPPISWYQVDPAVSWNLPALSVFPLALAVESISGDLYVLYLPDPGNPSEANVGVIPFYGPSSVAAVNNFGTFSPGGGIAASEFNGQTIVYVSEVLGASTTTSLNSCQVVAFSPGSTDPPQSLVGGQLQQVQALAFCETLATWDRPVPSDP